MGFLDRLDTKEDKNDHFRSNALTSLSELDKAHELSLNQDVLIFKHSTRCGISAMALEKLEHAWSLNDDEIKFFYLDLIAHRGVSNAIAEKYKVTHQSPQVLLIRAGNCIYNTSHHAINYEDILRQLDSAR